MSNFSRFSKKANWTYVAKAGALFVLYFILARLGLSFGAVGGVATTVWPPSGLAVAALFLFGMRLWPAIFFGAFFVNLSVGVSLFGALGIAIGNSLEAVVAVSLLRTADFKPYFERTREVVKFVFLGAVVGALISATIGATSSWLAGTITTADFARGWGSWWIGDTMGILIFGAVILSWYRRPPLLKAFSKIFEAVALFAVLTASSVFIFGNHFSSPSSDYLQPIFLLPLLIWSAVSFGPQGASLAVLVTSVIAVIETSLGFGTYGGDSLNASLSQLISFMGTISVTILYLSALVSEKITSRARDTALLSSIGDGLIAVDAHSKIIFSNPAAEQMLFLHKDDMVGKNESEVLVIEDDAGKLVPDNRRPLQLALMSGETIRTESVSPIYLRRRNGTKFPVSITVTPIFEGGKITGAVKAFRDITGRREIERIKNEFIALTSHQLRTPLTGIEWTAELFSKKEKLTPLGQSYLSDIMFSARRLSTLVKLILNTSKIQSGKISYTPEAFDIDEFILEVINGYNPILEKKQLKLSHAALPKKIKVFTDRSILEYILHNLILNAVDYTPPKGEIEIGAKQEEGGDVIVSVKDTGIGIPKKEEEQIFERFTRGSNAVATKPDGTGLGLYIVAESVKLMGGKIWFETKEGKGTSFYVQIPPPRSKNGKKQMGRVQLIEDIVKS